MSTIAHRLATEPGDYDRLIRHIRDETRFIEDGLFCSPGDLDWWLGIEDDPDARFREIPFWLDGDTIVGWCYSYKGQIDIFTTPAHNALLPDMIAWAESHARAAGSDEVEIYANEGDLERQRLYAAAGFVPGEAWYTFRRHSLDGNLPKPVLPEGYQFRDMSTLDVDDVERRVELHRVVWAPSRWTADKHRRVMRSSHYRADLDLIAVAPDGEFAAYTIVWYEPAHRYGVFEPVGCHPDHRQKGITSAVMYEGMRRLKELGAEIAYVNSWHASLPANRLYESCGFTEVERLRRWTKPLE